jgi:SAM-dependent methyltransferase
MSTKNAKLSITDQKVARDSVVDEFGSFVDFKVLKKTKRKPEVVKTGLMYLNKDLEANINASGIENNFTAFMLQQIGRGMIRYSRRFAWLNRHYTWASRVPVLKDKQRARVVDLGADVGEIKNIMSASFYYSNPLYLGVDLEGTNLSKGFHAMPKSKIPFMMVQHDITLPLKFIKSNSVHCVFCGETIEHIKEKFGKKLIKEVHRILKKRGKFFVSTPVKRNSKGYDFHVYEYEPEEMKEILKDAGFRILRSYSWVTTEKVLYKRMKEEDRKFYDKLKKKCHKDILMPVFCHLDCNYGDAFCVEVSKI